MELRIVYLTNRIKTLSTNSGANRTSIENEKYIVPNVAIKMSKLCGESVCHHCVREKPKLNREQSSCT